MSNDVFDALFRERVDVFRAAFSSVATETFYDSESKRLRHAGEYGMYRESIVRDFLQFIIPTSLDISTGFLLSSLNDVSTQCDIIIFDSTMTPLYQEGDRQRFFPMESVFCVGEVKSALSKKQFADAINKLATVKSFGERVENPKVLRKHRSETFDPTNHPYDLFPSILICQKLDFDLSNIENEIDSLYGDRIPHRHKHNMILSIEDGLLCYFDNADKIIPYPRFPIEDIKHTFVLPDNNKYGHFKIFGAFMFMLTTSKTLLYPEFLHYVGAADGGHRRNQV